MNNYDCTRKLILIFTSSLSMGIIGFIRDNPGILREQLIQKLQRSRFNISENYRVAESQVNHKLRLLLGSGIVEKSPNNAYQFNKDLFEVYKHSMDMMDKQLRLKFNEYRAKKSLSNYRE